MFREQFGANFGADLRFFRRNRLLLVLGLLFLVVTAISCVFSLVGGSGTSRFDLLRSTVSELNEFAVLFSGGLALFLVSSHVRNRSLKMVFTRPCLPETWLAAGFAAVLSVSAILFAAILSGAVFFSLLWKVPFQSGFVLAALEAMGRSGVVAGFLFLLTLLVHPVVAVFLVVLFNEGTFYSLRFLLLTAIKTTGGNPILPFLEKGTYLVYIVLPSFSPYGERMESVHGSMRAAPADWKTLGSIWLYAVAACGLFYFLSVFALRRKTLS